MRVRTLEELELGGQKRAAFRFHIAKTSLLLARALLFDVFFGQNLVFFHFSSYAPEFVPASCGV